jgi:hypothetical protein
MSAEARERQLVSLAYGNVKLEEDGATREQVVAAVVAARPQVSRPRIAARR